MIRIQGIPMVAERLQAGEVQSGIAMDPRHIIQGIGNTPRCLRRTEDRFAGYAVIVLPFRSGHVLSLRRFPASSVGPGYTSVWRRDPAIPERRSPPADSPHRIFFISDFFLFRTVTDGIIAIYLTACRPAPRSAWPRK